MDTLAKVSPRLKGTAVVHAKLALACFDMGELEKATLAWQTAIDSEQYSWDSADPATRSAAPIPFPASRVGLAQVQLELDQLEEAEALLVAALALQPQYPHAHYLLGQVYAETGREEEAEFEMVRGAQRIPSPSP